ncbi:hypothetical protein E2C01_035775 [Portunus trituberculatus]|uniref:Uncharacterized protein n=1 Tax=Portunus trituberculatus TaxID=210409 RepID=A0A5B7F571_PORTR|nr:hypothetical protein [Portunus trituberculatus]
MITCLHLPQTLQGDTWDLPLARTRITHIIWLVSGTRHGSLHVPGAAQERVSSSLSYLTFSMSRRDTLAGADSRTLKGM